MKRKVALLMALALIVPAVGVAAPAEVTAPGGAGPAPGYVAVDPLDLRKPVPNPEEGLTAKYDDKVVRFTGQVRRFSRDKKTKKYGYELEFVLVHREAVKGKKAPVLTREFIVVPVTFKKDEPELQKQVEALLLAKRPGPAVTIEGKGHVTGDGTLIITDAIIIPTGKKVVFD